MSEVKELLIKAKALIDTPEKWVQGFYATDNLGHRVSACSSQAVCFCSDGALRHAADVEVGSSTPTYVTAMNTLCEVVAALTQHRSHTRYNDEHTHAEVMRVFDLAIEIAP